MAKQTDYYPFGMIMDQRSTSTAGYRYGYNGKENDDDVKGEGNQQDYGARIYDPRVGRWLSPDPLAGEMASWSTYSFGFDSPLLFIDSDGRIPTPAEAARMALHSYGMKGSDYLIGGWRVSSKGDNLALNTALGLQSTVYERVVNGKVTEYAYGYAGSNDVMDWIFGNIPQPVGLSPVYEQAILNAKQLNKDLKGSELTFLGHSKGGGEAAAAAMVTGRNAITFNAAGVSRATKVKHQIPLLAPEDNIQAFVMITDPLNMAQRNPDALTSSLGIVANGDVTHVVPVTAAGYYNGHSMEEMVASIEQGATLANVVGAGLKTTGNVARGLGEKISNEVTKLIKNIRSALSNMIKEGEQQIMRAATNP